MTDTPLLRLLAQAHPERSQGDLLAMLDAIPDKPQKTTVQRRVGSRPRTDASMARRRSWAAAGRLPPALASRFTMGEVATLAVIAAEVVKRGSCRLAIDHIAALAGVGRSTVKRAIRQAHTLGLIRIEERRLTAWRNDTNVITVVDPGWAAWLRLGRRGGVQIGPPTRTSSSSASSRRENRSERVFGKAGAKSGGSG
jgi:hypothetical protein